MSTSRIVLFSLGGLLLILVFWTCSSYNGLVNAEVKVDETQSKIQSSYQRRTDLYNSIVEVIKSSAKFEQSTLKEVLEARSKAGSIKIDFNDPNSVKAFQDAQKELQGSFSRLMAVAENYPDLKTTQEYLTFQNQIEGTENRINVARNDYNKAVADFNKRVKRFPGNLVAGMFGYTVKPYFEAEKGAEKAPDLSNKLP
jgi:LemA protein